MTAVSASTSIETRSGQCAAGMVWRTARGLGSGREGDGNGAGGAGGHHKLLKPWAVLDKWTENWEDGKAATDPWSQTSDYDKVLQSKVLTRET
jgi:hypothetical protein